MAIVYRHIRLDTNDVFYIGVGKNEKRAYEINFRRNSYWRNIIKNTKYKVEITHKDICYEEALSIEKYLISFYGRSNKNEGTLCNLTDGGEGTLGILVSEETRNKFRGENNYMFGKTHSEEVRERMVNIITEKMKNPEVRKRISDKKKGTITSENVKIKLIKSSPKRKEIYQISNNELIKYDSIRQAAKILKISRKNMRLRPHNYNYLYNYETLPDYFKEIADNIK
jgi:group I intron endonuclease